MQNVAIGYIHYGQVTEPFMSCMLDMVITEERSTRNIATVFSVAGAYIPENRNRVVSQFLKEGHEWLLFLDVDVKFPPDLVQKLLVHADPVNAPIVAGLYFSKMGTDGKWWPLWLHQEGDNEYAICKQFPDELTPLTAAGTGCMIIHRSVLFRMKMESTDPWPWFGHDIVEKPDGSKVRAGEDITFCKRARALGFKIFGLREPLEHIKTQNVTIETYARQLTGDYSCP